VCEGALADLDGNAYHLVLSFPSQTLTWPATQARSLG
jgi:hypothetical protein